jgi:predicted CopG family antitoxin
MRYAKFTRPLTISLAPEVYDVLKEVSDAERKSMAELIRELLSEMVLPLCGSENDKAENSVSAKKGEHDNG